MRLSRLLVAGAATLMVAGVAALTMVVTPAPAAAAPKVAGASVNATDTPTDYADGAHWLHIADGKRKVDVFYVYPTAYARTSDSQPIFCPVDDSGMMEGARTAYTRQAWAFRTFANIYAPYYRQIDAKYQLSLAPEEQEANIEGPPSTDVLAAFQYYLAHYNHGRPFILAGHSQGSAVLRHLLSTYMKTHPRVYRRMIAAYIVGQSITREYLAANPHLKYATGADDTGVILSWNTEAPTTAAPSPVTLQGGIAINPITWTRAQTKVAARFNLGSIQLDRTTGTPLLNARRQILRVMRLADARVDRKKGVVICSTVPADQIPYYIAGGFPQGVLHTFDYPLYFFSVRANAAARAVHYLTAHGLN